MYVHDAVGACSEIVQAISLNPRGYVTPLCDAGQPRAQISAR